MTETDTERDQRADTPSGRRGSGWATLLRIGGAWARMKEASILAVTLVLFLWFFLRYPISFNSADNYHVVAQFVAPVAILAAGEVMLLICSEIDLSAGNAFAVAPLIMMLLHQDGIPMGLAVVIALACMAVVGITNGVVTVKFRVPSFVTTLGMLFFLTGVAATISHGNPISAPTEGFLPHLLGGSYWSEILWALAIIAVMHTVLVGTPFGVHAISTGGNLLGAAEAGVRVDAIKITNFAMSSVLAGFAGILDGFRITSFDPLAGGPELMFQAVAACVIGGTALLGGSGTVLGALIGATFLGILRDGLNIEGISAYTFDIILGLAIIAAMLLNVSLIRLRGRRRV